LYDGSRSCSITNEKTSVILLRCSLKHEFKESMKSRRGSSWSLFNFRRLLDPRLAIKPGHGRVKLQGLTVHPGGRRLFAGLFQGSRGQHTPQADVTAARPPSPYMLFENTYLASPSVLSDLLSTYRTWPFLLDIPRKTLLGIFSARLWPTSCSLYYRR